MHKLKPISQIDTILLVEDYQPALLAGSMMLEHLGYTVETASCGREAIEKVRTSATPFMAVLMDVEMQDINGFKVTQIIRRLERGRGYSTPIIAITAHALAGDREHCLKAGMNDYISKPINPETLAQKLYQLGNVIRN